MKYLHLFDPYQQAVIFGLLVYVTKKYILAPGWNLKAFLKTGITGIVTSVVTTATVVYLTPDAVKIIDSINLTGDMAKFSALMVSAPKVLGFLTGVTGGTLGYDLFAVIGTLNIPVLSPLVNKYVTRK